MPEAPPRDDGAGGWLPSALLIVAAVTAARVAGLWLSRTDLYVDESQYWLWGRNLDWGYYSKPPLIAWVIRAATGLAGADTPFAVRLPAPFFHAATALILAALADRLGGRRAAVWTAAAYVTMPFAALGSAVISTDTIMAPFFAAALFFYWRCTQDRRARDAVLAGLLLGAALMAKYAAVYFFAGMALAWLLVPSRRIGRANAALLTAAAGAVILPNLAWNLAHDLSTFAHTADNIGWVRGGAQGPRLNLAGLAEFLLSQLAVFGPVFLAVLAAEGLRPGRGRERWLLCFTLPAIAIVSLQALLSRAYANWAVSAYFAGTVFVVLALLARPRLLAAAVAVNALLSAIVLAAFAAAPFPDGPGGQPLLARYLGLSAFSRTVIAEAKARGLSTVVATRRYILADLFFTGAGSGLSFHALPPAGRPANYYEQAFPLPTSASGPVLAVLPAPPDCGAGPLAPVASPDLDRTAHAGTRLALYVLEADCARRLAR